MSLSSLRAFFLPFSSSSANSYSLICIVFVTVPLSSVPTGFPVFPRCSRKTDLQSCTGRYLHHIHTGQSRMALKKHPVVRLVHSLPDRKSGCPFLYSPV